MTGGVVKGAFQSGVIKAFAERNILPSVVVGASAGALNAGMTAKLIAEDNFKSEVIEEQIIKVWLYETSLINLWGKATKKNNTIRDILDIDSVNPFMIIKKLSNFEIEIWEKLKKILSLSFLSVFNNEPLMDILSNYIKAPNEIINNIQCTVSLTDLLGHTEVINNQKINNYSQYVNFEFKKGENENLREKFRLLREVILASASFPGMFPPCLIDINKDGNKRLYIDGGITKNAPFGRAIKLDSEVKYIFLISTTNISKPIMSDVNSFTDLISQLYEIIVTKDIANDYRKVTQINEKIKILSKILKKDKNNNIIDNQKNNELCKLAGFKNVKDYLSKRVVEIIFIEPEEPLEGDPFAGIYRKDNKKILESYVKKGYEVGNKILDNFFNRNLMKQENS
jgi:predicted acylesterase/phospholipase RssA